MTEPERPQQPQGAFLHRMVDGSDDLLAREEPLLLSVHGQQLMTMRTPGQDEDLALGFLLGEGIVRSTAEVARIEFQLGDAANRQPDEVRIELAHAPDASVRGRLARTHEIRSSCGVCGIADPTLLLDEMPPLLPGTPTIDRSIVSRLTDALMQRQPLFAATGGCHGAMLALADGSVQGHGEDIGRHNALDKAIGIAARRGTDFTKCVAVVSGRMGYDLAVKCLRIRVPILISVSAPSSLAVQLCSAAGATLIGFARGTSFRGYSDAGRLRDVTTA